MLQARPAPGTSAALFALALTASLPACVGSLDGDEAAGGSAGKPGSGVGGGQMAHAGRGGASSGGGTNPNSGGALPLGGSAGQGVAGIPQAGTGGSGSVDPPPNRPPPQSGTASWVFVDGYRLWVGKRLGDGTLETPRPYKLKGVGWSPVGIGQSNDGGYRDYYTQHAGSDVPLMGELHANTVKTYDAFERNAAGMGVLNNLYARGIMVVMAVVTSHGDANGKAYLEDVNYFKNHPGILMWLVGNEFNYNNLYGAANYDQARGIVQTAVADIKAADPDHPVAVSFGELPSLQQHNEINTDVWAINIYPGLDFGSRFNTWVNLSQKPMFVGEYGADAYDSSQNQENQGAQSAATTELTQQIMAQFSADNPSHCALGGTIYSLNDEWWKSGNAGGHDTGGFENAIHPDGFANEEWWGLVTIQRSKRAAFNALSALYAQP